MHDLGYLWLVSWRSESTHISHIRVIHARFGGRLPSLVQRCTSYLVHLIFDALSLLKVLRLHC